VTRWASILTEELDSLDKLVILWEIDNDDGLNVTAVRGVAQDTKSSKQDRHDKHDARQHWRELVWLTHALGDGDDPEISLCQHIQLTIQYPQRQRRQYR
jgi:hypothetical protein